MGDERNWQDGFWKWAARVGAVCSAAPYIGTGLALAGSAATTIWLALYDMPPPVIGILALVAFAALVWAWNGVWWSAYKRRTGTQAETEKRDDIEPVEGHALFVGRWHCGHGDPSLEGFIMTLNEDGTVRKSHVPDVSGTWVYSSGAARINTSDQWRDTLRRMPEGVIKFAYDERSGPLPDSSPTNYSLAEKLLPTNVGSAV